MYIFETLFLLFTKKKHKYTKVESTLDTITINSFTKQENVNIIKSDSSISIHINQANGFPGVILNNIEFEKNRDYVIFIQINKPAGLSLFFYSNDKSIYNPMKKKYLEHGVNKIILNIKKNNTIDLGILAENPETFKKFTITAFDIIDHDHELDLNKVAMLADVHFNENVGFGKHKNIAIRLLKETIQILDEFKIDYFLISGTLLGYIRHHDFIPWDDDIDLIVDASITDKLSDIIIKYPNVKFCNPQNNKWLIKSFYEKEKSVYNIENADWPENLNWTWPFVDLFIFQCSLNQNYLKFFNKTWDIDKFYPVQKKLFLGMTVSIPNDPDYFLKRNFGSDYMTVLKSSHYSHKSEKAIGRSVNIKAQLLKYKKR